MKHFKIFETTEAYNAATLDLPNVSLIEETMSVGFNPYVPETRLVAKYNVTSTSSPTALRFNYEQNIFKSMEIDGVMLDELVTEYTFDTTGVHTVKYELYDETKLGNMAPVFYNSNLVECIIPDSVTSIGNNAFYQCNGLTNIIIPNSVTSIGNMSFYQCGGLTSITIPDSVTYIGDSVFAYTSSLKVLNYNAKCELSSHFRDAWIYLETVIIGDSTPSISSNAFSGCNALTSVIIGNSVTSIGDSAFQNCTGLTSIVSNAMTAPTINNDTFDSVKANGILTVPSGSTGYDAWMSTDDYYLGKRGWTKVEQ